MSVYVYMKLIQYNETRPIPLVNMARVSFNYHMYTKSKKNISQGIRQRNRTNLLTARPKQILLISLYFINYGFCG